MNKKLEDDQFGSIKCNFSLNAETIIKLKKLAIDDDRSQSSMLRILITQAYNKQYRNK
jgi:hypothetical protein